MSHETRCVIGQNLSSYVSWQKGNIIADVIGLFYRANSSKLHGFASLKKFESMAKLSVDFCDFRRFSLRNNPYQHWSAAACRELDALQLKDGADILNINWDDQAGFKLDTLTTHSKHATLRIAENEPLTTKTDYINPCPSTFQTTSYNFSGTETKTEICWGS